MSTTPDTADGRIAIVATIRASWKLVREHPRESILPALLIQVPVTTVVALVTMFFLFTTYSDTEFRLLNELSGDDPGGLIFLLVVGAAVQALFAQVAHGATVVGIAGVLTGKPGGVTAALDAAFTRMGALLLMAVVLIAGAGLLFLTIIGALIVPFLAIRFALSYETLMIEKISVGAAFRRSFVLTRGHVLRMLGALLLGVLSALPAFIFVFFIGSAVAGGRTQQIVANTLVTIAQAFVLAPVYAVLTALTTIIYFKLRESDARRPV